MIDPATETPIPLGEVPAAVRWLPSRRKGKTAGVRTVFRWATDGLAGHRLETIRVGETLCTSEAALVRFFYRLTAAMPPGGGGKGDRR
jgi:hypothetical protein